MKIFIDGYGVVAQSITRKLIENHGISEDCILVNTYFSSENAAYLSYLDALGLEHGAASYQNMEFKKRIEKFSPDIIMSLYSRRIFPIEILRIARSGTFNLHPSFLPNYRGCFSRAWAIINGDEFTGITIHEMVESVDRGDILYQEMVPILIDDTAYTLWHKLADRFIAIFDSFFINYIADTLVKKPMPSGGSYYPRDLPFKGLIDASWGDVKIDAFIRGMHFPPFPGAKLNKGVNTCEVDSIEQFRRISDK